MRALGVRQGVGLIDTVGPALACAEVFADVAESTMFAVEAAAVAHVVAERRREYATVRYCARAALRQIGMPAVPLLPDGDGAPRWPAGVVGSMTHCPGYRAAAVAPARRVLGVGIDAEPHAEVPDEALDLILRDEERARLAALAAANPHVWWARVVFCAKEAAFKAWFPLTRRWVEFTDVSTVVCPDGTFRARLCVPFPCAGALDLRVLDGRWVIGCDLVVAAVSVASTPALGRMRVTGSRR